MAVGQMREEYAFCQQRACGLMTVAVSSYSYQSRLSDEPLRTRLVELPRCKPHFGYREHVGIHHAQHANRTPATHRVVYEIQRPLLIRRCQYL